MATHSHIAKAVKVREAVIDEVVKAITGLIDDGEKVTLKGIGTISRKDKAQRNGINPATQEKIIIPAKSVLYFKAAKDTARVLKPVKAAKAKK